LVRYEVDFITVVEKSRSINAAIIKIVFSLKGGVLIIRTSSICPDKSRLKTIPSIMPLKMDTTILMRISRNTMSLISKTGRPIALSILKTSAYSLHFPYV
jgi:hypothetical protein